MIVLHLLAESAREFEILTLLQRRRSLGRRQWFR